MKRKVHELTRAQSLTILGGAAVMLSLAMGMRQSMGLLQPHVVRDLAITAADYSMAIALQNIVWGVTQPFTGALVDRFGARPVALFGVLVYLAGLIITAQATSAWMITLGIGVCVGLALSCTASNLAMNVTARAVTPARRSVAMGAVSAAGSLGLVLASPLAQAMIQRGGWTLALTAFCALAVVMIPAAFMAGGADQVEAERDDNRQTLSDALREAFGHSGYVTLAMAFFVCGLQLVFLTTHLPSYLDLCGIDPSVTASALALIGLFNVFGSYLCGWLGGRYPRHLLLGGIYILRSAIITVYFLVPPTPLSTLIFAAAMGTLWLGVVPLVNGLVVQLFGLKFMATLTGVAFFSHQLGSFLGAWGGGVIFQAVGSYDRAWQAAVVIGLVAGAFQLSMNTRPSARWQAAQAAS
ncbi:MAG: MFS transporter [Burkholderiales bacterium]|jgi:predicted MFS family arabinose efflux permease